MLANSGHYVPPYRVLSATGYTLGKFSKHSDAMFAFRTWSQSVAVIQGNRVVARRPKSGPQFNDRRDDDLPRKRVG